MSSAKSTQSPDTFPTQAQVVIIGGGVIGCSVAYHLPKLGWKDVVLLERSELTAGTTWHAAGLIVSGGFTSETSINMAKYTRELYARLEEETGQGTGFMPIGVLVIACDQEELEELRRSADFARGFGVITEEISTAEVKKMWPLMDTSKVLAGFITAEDGRANPVDLTLSLAKGARMGGVNILEGTQVTGITQEKGRVTGVVTNRGTIQAEYVVNCGGMWARELGQMAGVNVPLHAAEHYYLITEPIEGMQRDLPIVEDVKNYSYFREETGGLLLGLFEPVAGPWGMKGIPKDFSFGEIAPDWDRMMPFLEKALERIPAAQEAGVHKFFCGPESFTPDMSPLMGEAPELKNYYVAAGFNSLGVLLGGGAGQVLAQWMVDGYPSVDTSEIDIARMQSWEKTPQYLHDRTEELLGWMFHASWPNFQAEKARDVRRSPFYDRMAQAGAYFGQYAGWEYADWFAPEGVEPKVEYSWKRQNWFEYAAAEHRAAREGVILMDYTVFAKFLVQGREAEKVLNRICANNVSVPVGRIVYTQWLSEQGTIVADLTVTRLAEDVYYVITAEGTRTQVYAWLKRNIPPEAHAFVTDVSAGEVTLNLQGPKSREVLSKVTNADVSNQAFPYLTMQEIDIGYALVKALRVTYVGELGWELYIPPGFALPVFDRLVEAGEEVGMKFAGLQALDSLRIEKGYRDFAGDIDNTDTPLNVGLNYFVDYDKPGGFIGREALLKRKESGPPTYRLAQFLLEDPEPLLYGNEPIYRDGEFVGHVMAGAYGHTLGGAIGAGHVENEKEGVTAKYIRNGKYEIKVASQRFPARVSLRPLYDPKNERVRS